MIELKLPKSKQSISYTFEDIKERQIDVRFNLPEEIPKGLRQEFFTNIFQKFHHPRYFYNAHSYLYFEVVFDCGIEEFSSMLKEELNLLDMNILSFNNKLKVAESILLESYPCIKFDVAFSFAGEDRSIVYPIAEELKNQSISVFYDEFEKGNLWGKDLSKYFKSTYTENTRFVVPFISKHYPNKDWTNFEFTVAHEEAKKRDSEFILPVRIDDTLLVGLPNTVSYLDYNVEGKDGIVEAILSKLKT